MNDESSNRQLGDWRQVLERYERGYAEQSDAVQTLGRRWNQLSYLRGALFIVALMAAFAGIQSFGGLTTIWWFATTQLVIAFLIAVGIHDRIEREWEAGKQQAEFFAESMARCRRDWRQLPVPPIGPSGRFRQVALDLDVFGRASLSQLFGVVRTAVGLPVLAEWLSAPAQPVEIGARQAAAADLGRNTAWRESLQLRFRIAAASPVGSERFLAWIGSPGWLGRLPVLVWYARLSALLTLASIAGFFSGIVPAQVAGVATMILLALNFLVTVFTSGKVHEIFEHVSSRKYEVNQYVDLFGQMAELQSDAGRLKELRAAITQGPLSAIAGMGVLSQIVWLGNLRRHGILFIAYLFLQFVVVWDLHLLFWLERWQARYRDRVPDWFAALGQIEVLAALGTVAHEHPEWAFPQVESSAEPHVTAEQLGHPLLPNDVRVRNDVQLGPPGTVVIVTGSNMSGKSTLLRSLGLNLILGQMGSVVCAKRMAFSPVVLETSMRIDDSLSDGVSFFMAELKRLKEIVDRSAEIRAGGGSFLFLLDEILQGTNSRERHIAVGAVIQQLLDQGAFGSFTTHDLDLARDEGLARRSRSVYFTESFEKTASGDVMTFDYLMRPGVAPSTNALKLLRIVGLAAEERKSETPNSKSE